MSPNHLQEGTGIEGRGQTTGLDKPGPPLSGDPRSRSADRAGDSSDLSSRSVSKCRFLHRFHGNERSGERLRQVSKATQVDQKTGIPSGAVYCSTPPCRADAVRCGNPTIWLLRARGMSTTAAFAALSRKLARVCFALLQNNTNLSPNFLLKSCALT